MKRISLLYIIPLLFSVLLISSCDEDEFLSISEAGVVTSSDYLTTEEGVETAVVGIYSNLQTLHCSGFQSLFLLKNLPGDDCLAASSTSSNSSDYQNVDDFSVETDNSFIETAWSDLYTIINRSNTLINGADPSISDYVVQMIAEAKAMRAYSYLELVTMFGGVPLRVVNASDEADYSIARSTAEEIYAQIESDLLDAIEDLPLKSECGSGNKYRMSKGAAQAFLGKAYLYQNDYANAVEQFESVIASGEYALVASYDSIWRAVEEFGDESLFEVPYTPDNSYTWSSYTWGSSECNLSIGVQGIRSDDVSFSSSTLAISDGWGYNRPSAEIGLAFENAGDTIVRGAASIISEEDLVATGAVIQQDVTHDYEGYQRLKYQSWSSETDLTATALLNFGTDWRLMRYADVLLMAAEANYFEGDEGTALTYLNQVRTRAGLVSAGGDDLFDAIVLERELELAFEASRFWDLVRWGLADEELSDIGFVSGRDELFPIPQDEIDSNTAIGEEDQNPGY
jgi:tetratricopeptide (TPR) repeat protein